MLGGNSINTENTLKEKFVSMNYNLLKKRVIEVSVFYVITNMLKEDFIVDIDGSLYDITFGKNNNDEIGYYQMYYPNAKQLTSSEIIEQGFKYGKWYLVTDEDLSEEEFSKAKSKLDYLDKLKLDREKKELDEGVKETLVKLIVGALVKRKRIPKEYAKNLEKEILELNDEAYGDFIIKFFKERK